jgi:hypothetical protein
MEGDGPVEAPLGRREPRVEAGDHVAHVVVERGEAAIDLRGVGHEILWRAAAQDHPLVGAQAAQRAHQYGHGDEGDERQGRGRQRDDPRCRGQVVHCPRRIGGPAGDR